MPGSRSARRSPPASARWARSSVSACSWPCSAGRPGGARAPPTTASGSRSPPSAWPAPRSSTSRACAGPPGKTDRDHWTGGPTVSDVSDPTPQVALEGDAYYQDPAGFFAWLREDRPVTPVRMPGYGRAWVVSRYGDVRAVLNDPRMGRDVRRWPGGGRTRPSEATGIHAHMLHFDPPDHTRLRRLVQKPFASRRAALRPRAEQIAAGLLDEMARCSDDPVDLLGQYAR